jgi:hypothetical protein
VRVGQRISLCQRPFLVITKGVRVTKLAALASHCSKVLGFNCLPNPGLRSRTRFSLGWYVAGLRPSRKRVLNLKSKVSSWERQFFCAFWAFSWPSAVYIGGLGNGERRARRCFLTWHWAIVFCRSGAKEEQIRWTTCSCHALLLPRETGSSQQHANGRLRKSALCPPKAKPFISSASECMPRRFVPK